MPPLFEEVNLYDSPSGLLRFVRKALNPILRLFFNPTPIAHALAVQGRLNADAATRETERERRQAEWNALHYEILQRLVTEVARVSLEAKSSLRVESLRAVDSTIAASAPRGHAAPVRAPRPQETRAAPRRNQASPGCATGTAAAQTRPTASSEAGQTQLATRSRRRRAAAAGVNGPRHGAPPGRGLAQ